MDSGGCGRDPTSCPPPRAAADGVIAYPSPSFRPGLRAGLPWTQARRSGAHPHSHLSIAGLAWFGETAPKARRPWCWWPPTRRGGLAAAHRVCGAMACHVHFDTYLPHCQQQTRSLRHFAREERHGRECRTREGQEPGACPNELLQESQAARTDAPCMISECDTCCTVEFRIVIVPKDNRNHAVGGDRQRPFLYASYSWQVVPGHSDLDDMHPAISCGCSNSLSSYAFFKKRDVAAGSPSQLVRPLRISTGPPARNSRPWERLLQLQAGLLTRVRLCVYALYTTKRHYLYSTCILKWEKGRITM